MTCRQSNHVCGKGTHHCVKGEVSLSYQWHTLVTFWLKLSKVTLPLKLVNTHVNHSLTHSLFAPRQRLTSFQDSSSCCWRSLTPLPPRDVTMSGTSGRRTRRSRAVARQRWSASTETAWTWRARPTSPGSGCQAGACTRHSQPSASLVHTFASWRSLTKRENDANSS